MSAQCLSIRLRLARAAFDLNVQLQLSAQAITVIFGASGAGKTSLLRCLAGFERAHEGRIALGSALWQDSAQRVFVPAHRRAIGYVFQEPSLFAHMNVNDNVRYGLKRARSAQAHKRLDAAIELLGIGPLLARRVQQLSGGERSRVAIARALAADPRLLLLDEPLAAVDRARRLEVLPWLVALRDELGVPMLYVTHQTDELAALADEVVVLEGGRLRAAGRLSQIMTAINPPCMGGDEVSAVLQGTVAERDAQWHLARVSFEGGALWVRDGGLAVGQSLRLRILAADVSLSVDEPCTSSVQNVLLCEVDAMASDRHSAELLVRLRCGPSAILLARLTRRAQAALGIEVGRRLWAQVGSVALL
ncbi:MAG TPA: molybdenum ABC transporter ATP-binding protein [Burkholderiaceae bacterium]|nr:molybdenum ABC transporter ATP-binding protein [Burkholderiaceae bacterium]